MLKTKLLRALGPGLLFAAVSVGVSHLVQSTRAGALYGFAMLAFIIFANAAKYPAFRFGQQYASVTGTSLLEGFRRQGLWTLIVVALIVLFTAFPAVAAVGIVTAGLAKIAFNLSTNPIVVSGCLLATCSLMLIIGRYRLLDLLIKILILVMTISTLIATILSLPLIDWSVSGNFVPREFDPAMILFIATLVGWMPAPLDTAIWQSLWTLEKNRTLKEQPDVNSAAMDFNIGYIGTAILAICFLIMGTAIMHGKDIEFENSATAFAAQLVAMYEQTLGSWSRPIISITGFAVMISTMLVVLDGFPRTLLTLTKRFRSAEEPNIHNAESSRSLGYALILLFIITGALMIQIYLMASFKLIIVAATMVSFLSAPIFAWLIHRAMFSATIPVSKQPPLWLRRYSLFGIAMLAFIAVFYMYLIISNL